MGAFACGLGAADVAVPLVTGQTWFTVPETVLIEFVGTPGFGIGGKDVILHVLGTLKRNTVALDRAVEFSGPGLAHLSADARFAIANMTTEFGGIVGVFEADEITARTLAGRTCAWRGEVAGGWGRNGGARVQNGCGWKQAGHRVCRAAMDHDARKKLLEERKKKLEEMKLKRAGCAGLEGAASVFCGFGFESRPAAVCRRRTAARDTDTTSPSTATEGASMNVGAPAAPPPPPTAGADLDVLLADLLGPADATPDTKSAAQTPKSAATIAPVRLTLAQLTLVGLECDHTLSLPVLSPTGDPAAHDLHGQQLA